MPGVFTWGIMALRLPRSHSPGHKYWRLCLLQTKITPCLIGGLLLVTVLRNTEGQVLLKPAEPGEAVNLMPADQAILEADEPRKDIPCSVTEHKPELGFDLRFHSGYDVTVPLRELAGEGDMLTVLFRVYPGSDKTRSSYFVQHFHVPDIEEDAKGDALLQGIVDVGEGRYHVDWLMRDRSERICSSDWEVEATLGPKEKTIPLFIKPNDVAQTALTASLMTLRPRLPTRTRA